MRIIVFISIFYGLIVSCTRQTNDHVDLLDNGSVDNKKVLNNKGTALDYSIDCNFIYDTITSEKYRMHLAILDKFNNKEKRGYFFTATGDTLNKFLYHQDIASFSSGLDSTESGIYKLLTNKVVFLILEHEPKMLDYGLVQSREDEERLDYFMEHVAHPICNSIPMDSLAQIIRRDMDESHRGAIRVKQMLLDRLEQE